LRIENYDRHANPSKQNDRIGKYLLPNAIKIFDHEKYQGLIDGEKSKGCEKKNEGIPQCGSLGRDQVQGNDQTRDSIKCQLKSRALERGLPIPEKKEIGKQPNNSCYWKR